MADIKIYGTLIRDDKTFTDKIVQANQIDGGYFVCENLPDNGVWAKGQLCYCTEDSKFYQYTGDIWEEASFSNLSDYFLKTGGDISGHIYLTGAKESSSTSNSSQIVFGKQDNQYVAISSNNNTIVINPNTSETTNQIILYLDKQSEFPMGITSAGTIDAKVLTQDGSAVALKSEVEALLENKANTHDHPYLPDSTTYAGSSTIGGAANSVKSNLVVNLNGGTTEGTNLFTFNGSETKTISITPDSIGAAIASHNHDDNYYTENEINNLLLNKADTTHTHNYAGSSSVGGAANSVKSSITFNNTGNGVESGATFNGSTDQTISYNTIGAAATSHTHTKSQITDFEHNHNDVYYPIEDIDFKLNNKSDVSHSHSDYCTKSDIETEVKSKVETKLNEIFSFDSTTGILTINTLYSDE